MFDRFHGTPPYRVAVIHGGPGAQGSAYPLAAQLGRAYGVLEPMQTADTVDGQVDELAAQVQRFCIPPVALVGHSWGAWLSLLVAARRPALVRRLILVGSGPVMERYAGAIMETRLRHLPPDEAREARECIAAFGCGGGGNRRALFARLGALLGKADAYDALPSGEPYESACDADIHESVWAEAAQMRRSGALMDAARSVRCPVLAVHGKWDPHPWQGVKEPLEAAIPGFRFVLLERCGHEPWAERWARDAFFSFLSDELDREDDRAIP